MRNICNLSEKQNLISAIVDRQHPNNRDKKRRKSQRLRLLVVRHFAAHIRQAGCITQSLKQGQNADRMNT
jgi:hypothetical protein